MMRIQQSIACLMLLVFIVSCEELLEVTDISEQSVELLAPLEGTSVNDSLVNFTWNGVEEANAYHIQVATPDFDNASQLVLDSIIVLDSTFFGTKASKALLNGSYEWRVKGMNSDFETPFSLSAFTVETTSN